MPIDESTSLMNAHHIVNKEVFDVNSRHPIYPKQNNIVEWMNKTIQERIVAMMKHSNLFDGFGVEALLPTMHIINMLWMRPLKFKISQELQPQHANYDKLWIVGYEAFALVPEDERIQL